MGLWTVIPDNQYSTILAVKVLTLSAIASPIETSRNFVKAAPESKPDNGLQTAQCKNSR